MAEGTNVGSVYLDLVVRDTVDKQIQAIAAKAQAQAQQAFSNIEKIISDAAERAVSQASKSAQDAANSVDKAVHKVVNSAASAGKQVDTSFGGAFDKSVALAQARVNELVRALDAVTAKLDAQWNAGTFDAGSKATSSLLAQQEKLLAKLESAEERLLIAKQSAAQKTALIAEQTAAKQQAAVQRQKAAEEAALQRTAAAAERASARREAAEQKAAVAAERAAQRAADAEERAANRRKAIQASMWKNMLASAGSMTKSIAGKLVSIGKGFLMAGKSAGGFGSRLKGIVSGALVFNVLSRGLTNMVKYMGTAIGASEEMQTALANLKGAAATAAAPLWDALTPALAALANGAATALSYLSQLISFFTGKTVASMSNAAKKIQSTANTAKKAMGSLAGFDEIQRLGGDSGSSGSGENSVEPNFDFQGQSSLLDSVMESVKAGQWNQVGALVAQKLNDSLAAIKWPDIQEKAKTWTQNLVDTINGFVGNLDLGGIGQLIGNGLNSWMLIIDTFFQSVDWVSLGSGLGTGLNDLISTIDWPMLGRILTDRLRALLETLHGFLQTFDFSAFGSDLAAMFNAAFGNINWTQLAKDVCKGITGLLEGATAFVSDLDWVGLGTTIYDCIMAVDWAGMIDGLLELLATLATGLLISLGAGLFQAFQDLGATISGYFTEVGETGIQGFLNGMGRMLWDIGAWLYDHLVKPVIEGVCNALGIHSPSTVFEEIGGNLIAGLFRGISSAWTSITTFFTEAFESLQEKMAEIWEDGILPAIKGPINSIIGFVNSLISGICEGVNTIIRAMNKLKWDVPDWVPVLGGKSFGFNLNTITAPQIPMLASGGVIKQPTLAMMGEYAGARNNPEIVTPQSIMAETVSSVMKDMVSGMTTGLEANRAVLEAILEAIYEIDTSDERYAKAVDAYNRKMAVVRGGV